MLRYLIVFALLLFAFPVGQTETSPCEKSETACLLDAAWSAALILPADKRQNLASAFLEIAALSKEADLVARWEARFEQTAPTISAPPDYGWLKAEPILRETGVDGLIAAASQRQAPLNFGRADALLSAGKHLRDENPSAALRLNQTLMSLTQSASSFEKPSLGHAAAELAMVRCDGDLLTRAVALTDAPQNLRYAFWRARIFGESGPLLARVRTIENDQDTREVRRVLDGYRAILELGYCAQSKSAIGG